jgi:hypothetical protein
MAMVIRLLVWHPSPAGAWVLDEDNAEINLPEKTHSLVP